MIIKTIATISTPTGSGAISIVRMSGDKALRIASRMFSTKKLESFSDAQANYLYLGTVTTDTVQDKALAVVFRAPSSYTGEDVVEFQCHGGVRLAQEILRGCIALGAQPATKGEFTRRAFVNGKLALSDCEGIIDMINGESISAINAGYRLSQGGIATTLTAMQARMLDVMTDMEASLDYPLEMEDESKINCRQVLGELLVDLREFVASASVGKYIKGGIAVAIVGQANVGKSSLLNALLGKNRAIVTDIAGTTRDTLEEMIEVNGVALKLIDTAGIRNTGDAIEAIGVERSLESMRNADITLFVTEAGRGLNTEEKALLDTIEKNGGRYIKVYNKCELGVADGNDDGILISVYRKHNLDLLTKTIVQMFVDKNIDSSAQIITSERHVYVLNKAIASLENVLATLDDYPTECLLIDMRQGYFALGEITGNTANELIIDNIFNKFCLGK
ncbi:MAG: tRNA uridine-5-carboxymethylaminomethyl(34) synthesis GTPase MnmE [Clostridia bacterium]